MKWLFYSACFSWLLILSRKAELNNIFSQFNHQIFMENINYEQFLKTKKKSHIISGFSSNELNENLFDFQRFIVKKALKCGKYAVFADCGLGKTIIQLEWANQVVKYTNKSVIILCPLAVSAQTIQEGHKFGIKIDKMNLDSDFSAPSIFITNYEQINNFDFSNFSGVVLDESSILKNFEGEIKKNIIDKFSKTHYKLACTATPSPNDPMELCNHAEFLDVISRNEMLAMYFVHDGGETSKWRLKGYAKNTFFNFVGTWAVMLSKPQDIGFAAKGYDLPPLNIIEKEIKTEVRENHQKLFNDISISATNFNSELRLTKVERMEDAAKIVNETNEQFIIWVKQNEEGDYIKKLIRDAIEVKGSDTTEYKEKMLLGFANKEFRVLITKSKIAQYGLNFQNCHNQIFASLDFSFEGLYQSIRRSYRFGQKNVVNIYLITTDTMTNVRDTILKKEQQFEEMKLEMGKVININLEKPIEKTNNSKVIMLLPNFLKI